MIVQFPANQPLTPRLFLPTASFHVFDKDHDGMLSKEELRNRLRALARSGCDPHLSQSESLSIDAKVEEILEDAFKIIDTRKDGGIDVQEYINAFSNGEVVLQFMTALRA